MSNDVQSCLARARALMAIGQPSEALEALDALLQRPEAMNSEQMIDLLLASGAALSLVQAPAERLIETYRRAIRLLEADRAGQNVARLAGARHQLAMSLRDAGATEESASEWIEAANLARSLPENDAQRSWILVGLVPFLVGTGQFHAALPLAQEALTLSDPLRQHRLQRVLDRLLFAQALAGAGRATEARVVLKTMLQNEAAEIGRNRALDEAREFLESLGPESTDEAQE